MFNPYRNNLEDMIDSDINNRISSNNNLLQSLEQNVLVF